MDIENEEVRHMKRDVGYKEHNLNETCYGCAACYDICPVDAISMKVDEMEGYRPCVDSAICIGCEKCIKCCPAEDNREYVDVSHSECFAFCAENDIRLKSSSGGFFTVAAKKMLSRGGSVYGVAWANDLVCVHRRITKESELVELRYSKYVQSDLREILKLVREDLQGGKSVLFTGTPCQIAGVYSYLSAEKVDTEALLTIDLFCEYAPSPFIWRKYLEERYGKNIPKDYRFRDKNSGWECHGASTHTFNGLEYKHIVCDEYLDGFLKGMFVRDVCLDCNYRMVRPGDISMGDFWALKDTKTDDSRGISEILINTERGKDFFESIKNSEEFVKSISWDVYSQTGAFFRPPKDGNYIFKKCIKRGESFAEAYEQGVFKRYDIGLVGPWYNFNYGSHLTYHALRVFLEARNYSVLLIGPPYEFYEGVGRSPFGDEAFKTIPIVDENVAFIPRGYFDFEQYNDRCRIFVLGSDINFHPKYFFGTEKIYGLDWTRQSSYRIGYAASFGERILEIEPEKLLYMKNCIQRFDQLSFREREAAELCERTFNKGGEHVLDPVFFLKRGDWEQLQEKPDGCEGINRRYGIFCMCGCNYLYKSETIDFIKKVEDKYDANTIVLGYPTLGKDGFFQRNYVENLNVNEFLWMLNHAEYIITDSYHVMLFSIIFEKTFYQVARTQMFSSRIYDFLYKFGMEDCIIYDYRFDEVALDEHPIIDYKILKTKIKRERIKSEKWLLEALGEGMKKNVTLVTEGDFLRKKLSNQSRDIYMLNQRTDSKKNGELILKASKYVGTYKTDGFELLMKFAWLQERGVYLSDILKNKGCNSIALYGAGKLGSLIYSCLKNSDIDIAYIIDRNVKQFMDEDVYEHPQDPSKINVDAVLVSVVGCDEEINQLLKSYLPNTQIESIDRMIEDTYGLEIRRI